MPGPRRAPRPGKQVLRSLGRSEGLSLRTQFSARERGARARRPSPPPLPLRRVETSLEQPLLGHRARERPPDTRAPAACGHVQTAFPAVGVPGSGSQDPRQSSVHVGTLLGNGPRRPGRAMEGEPGNATEDIKGKPSPSSERQRLTI